MNRTRRLHGPLPYLDELPLTKLWDAKALSIGSVVDVGDRRYRVTGFDPVSVDPPRVYLEDVDTGRQHSLRLVRNT